MSVVFQEYDGVHIGIGKRGRRWHISRTATGWRLEFRDTGDPVMTYVGTHKSLTAAMSEAGSSRPAVAPRLPKSAGTPAR